MNKNKFWRRNRSKIVFGFLAVGSLAMNFDNITQNMALISSLRREFTQNNAYLLRLEENETVRKEQAKIANQRLKAGCTPVVDSTNIQKDDQGRKLFTLAPLQPGKPVKDRGNLTKLIPGTCVVGAFGDTGIIQPDWTVGDIAVGGSKQLVDKNINAIAGRSSVVYRVTPTTEVK